MTTIPYYLEKSKRINQYITLMVDIGYSNFEKLPEINKDKILYLIIQELGEDAYDLIIEKPILNKFNAYLLSDSRSDAMDFVFTIKNMAFERYKEALNEMFGNIRFSLRGAA